MIKILILGGSGILSTDVLKESLQRNYDVTCITRGNRDDRIPEGVHIIHGDIHNLEEVCKKIDDEYDAVLDFLSFTVQDLKYKLDHLAPHCKQYFFVSSSTAYSFCDAVVTEETPLGNEFWDYGDNKVRCEEFLKKRGASYGIYYTIIRPYITYGKTRIPFAIIPDGQYWSLAHRILNKKPVLLWDEGKALCTLTNTVDFARGFVDLIMNEEAFDEAFHITSDEVLSWREVLETVGKALGVAPIVYSASTEKIIELMPEYAGILNGDKARDRVFDNSKIKRVAHSFHDFIPFSDGIEETIQSYRLNAKDRTVNYRWDGRIDWAIAKLCKNSAEKRRYKLSYVAGDTDASIRNGLRYFVGKYPVILESVKKLKQRKNGKKTVPKLHKIGSGCTIGNVDFGLDGTMISIGSNVYLSDGVQFINYRPSAEFFNQVLDDTKRTELRDLGPITINNNVFVSKGVLFLPGANVGSNSMILENSVVYGKIAPNSVVGGNPAKEICSINEWYQNLIETNEGYPWYGKGYDHERIVKEREHFFGGLNETFFE